MVLCSQIVDLFFELPDLVGFMYVATLDLLSIHPTGGFAILQLDILRELVFF